MMTANIVFAAIVLSLVGATFAVGFRHYSAQNWKPHPEDIWYYIISGSLSVMLAVLGFDTASILAASSGVNMPLALVKTGWDKYQAGKVMTVNTANIDALKLQVAALEAKAKAK